MSTNPQGNQALIKFNVNNSGALGEHAGNRNVANKPAIFSRSINPSLSNAPPSHKTITTTGTLKWNWRSNFYWKGSVASCHWENRFKLKWICSDIEKSAAAWAYKFGGLKYKAVDLLEPWRHSQQLIIIFLLTLILFWNFLYIEFLYGVIGLWGNMLFGITTVFYS